jgi:hypothetical protein
VEPQRPVPMMKTGTRLADVTLARRFRSRSASC